MQTCNELRLDCVRKASHSYVSENSQPNAFTALAYLCVFQRDCIQFAINAKPRQRFMPEDKNAISYKVWVLVESKPFEITIMVLIALNAIVLMMSVGVVVL